jgi:hypothetical protein
MPFRDVQDVLTAHSLSAPDLEMLRPTEQRYRCLLIQPSGPIFAGNARIGSLDSGTAQSKGRRFLELARSRNAHLAVTPEYFLPWTSLRSAITDGVVPNADSLWVLGCESLSPDQLDAFKQAVGAHCLVIHEEVGAGGTLLDPAVMLFRARAAHGDRLVALIQFKTYPSRDNLFFEEAILKRGTLVYRFRGTTGQLSAATILCSDSFAIAGNAVSQLVDRATLIHIQLNPDPRNPAYRAYRAQTFQIDPKASDCHIICLNWARAIVQHGDAQGAPASNWNNIAGSAWYCPADACSPADQIILPNHQKGLYYTCLCKERRHALLFHYEEAAFELLVPKLLTTGAAVMANRNGPSATQRYVWSNAEWQPATHAPDSGFDNVLASNADAQAALQHVVGVVDVIRVERVLALSAGMITGLDSWHVADEIDSFQMEADEVVQRITFAQDMSVKAADFRHHRLARVAHLRHEIATVGVWPPQVAGMNNQARIESSAPTSHFNVVTADGRPTLVVHLGESPAPRHLENTVDMLYELLRRAGGPYQKRLCVIYRQYGAQRFAPIPGLTRFDDALENSRDILNVQPSNDVGGADHA